MRRNGGLAPALRDAVQRRGRRVDFVENIISTKSMLPEATDALSGPGRRTYIAGVACRKPIFHRRYGDAQTVVITAGVVSAAWTVRAAIDHRRDLRGLWPHFSGGDGAAERPAGAGVDDVDIGHLSEIASLTSKVFDLKRNAQNATRAGLRAHGGLGPDIRDRDVDRVGRAIPCARDLEPIQTQLRQAGACRCRRGNERSANFFADRGCRHPRYHAGIDFGVRRTGECSGKHGCESDHREQAFGLGFHFVSYHVD